MYGFFDETYYLNHKVAQLAKTGVNDANGNPYTPSTLKAYLSELGLTPESHYNAYGRGENLNPNPYFNETEYLTAKLELLKKTDSAWADKSIDELRAVIEREGMTPAEHYERYGAFEADANGVLLNPSNAFDANAYFAAKLVEMKASGFVGAETMTVAQVMAIFRSEGLSPVTHYAAYGATEATASKNPLVQTVPSEQRVANDPARTENVPGNFNPPTVGAVSPNAVASPVTKPADVGAKVPGTVSPPVVPPSKPLPAPGDNGYIKPPAGLVDTNEQPVVIVPPAKPGDAPQLGIDKGDGTIVKPGTDGKPSDEVIGGVGDDGEIVPTPTPPSGGGGGGGGGTPEIPDAPADLKMEVTTNASAKTLTITGTTGTQGGSVTFDSSGNAIIGTTTIESGIIGGQFSINASAVTGSGTLTIDASAISEIAGVFGSSTSKNIIKVKGASSIKGGSNDDTVTLNGSNNGISLGDGDDTLNINSGGTVSGDVATSNGDDKIIVSGGGNLAGGTVDMGEGDDSITVISVDGGQGGIGTDGEIIMGVGNNTITMHAATLNLGMVELTAGEKLTIDIQSGGTASGELQLIEGAEVTLKGIGTLTAAAVTGTAGSDSIFFEGGTTIGGAIVLGAGGDVYSLDTSGGAVLENVIIKKDDTASVILESDATTASTTGCDLFKMGAGDTAKIHLAGYDGASGDAVTSGDWHMAVADVTAVSTTYVEPGDNKMTIFTGTYANNTFTFDTTAPGTPAAYLVVYDADNTTTSTDYEAVVVTGNAGFTIGTDGLFTITGA